MKLKEIADKLDCKLTGRGDIEINRVVGINEAGEGDITFVSNPKYMKYIKTTGASAIILAHDAPEVSIPSLRCDNPYYIFAKTLEFFYNPPLPSREIHSTAVISPGSVTGNNPSIHAYAVIGKNVTIGDNAVIYPHVVIYDNVTIGNNVTIHSGSVIREKTVIGNNVIIQNGVVIGADGFAFVRREDGSQHKLPQTGRVVIEDDVEIQANSAVDCATIGYTVIKKGAKIDNLVQIAHSCSVGENTIICGQVGLSGSTVLGKNVTLAGQVGTAGHMAVGDNVTVVGKSGIVNSVESNKVIAGLPAIDASLWRRNIIYAQKLPELFKKIKKLEKLVEKLDKAVSSQYPVR